MIRCSLYLDNDSIIGHPTIKLAPLAPQGLFATLQRIVLGKKLPAVISSLAAVEVITCRHWLSIINSQGATLELRSVQR